MGGLFDKSGSGRELVRQLFAVSTEQLEEEEDDEIAILPISIADSDGHFLGTF